MMLRRRSIGMQRTRRGELVDEVARVQPRGWRFSRKPGRIEPVICTAFTSHELHVHLVCFMRLQLAHRLS